MKVLHINEVYKYGSTGRIAYELCDVLENVGYETLVCYGRNHLPRNEGGFDISSKFDNALHCVLTRITDRHGMGSHIPTYRLIKKIQAFQPDLIHLQNIHGYFVNIKMLFSFLQIYDKPVVWTLQDCWALTGHCYHFDYSKCMKWKTGCHHCSEKHNYPTSWIVDNSRNNWKAKKRYFTKPRDVSIVCSSKWLQDIVKESYLSKYPTYQIYNGIDLSTFKPTEGMQLKSFVGNKKIVLGVANVWSERKGIHFFEQLLDILPEEYMIVIIGNLRGRQMKKNIVYIPQTQNVAELVEIYSAADVFVNPTLEDTFPTTNMEALACGTPVVTFKTGGSPESVSSECGYVVEKEDLVGLRNAIMEICKKNISKETCVRYAKRFNKNNLYYEYIELYKKLTPGIKQ